MNRLAHVIIVVGALAGGLAGLAPRAQDLQQS